MSLRRQIRDLEDQVEEALHVKPRHRFMRNVGLATAGVTVVALGVVVGRELRERYKFTRRTPYDFYEHSGDSMSDVEFGVGI